MGILSVSDVESEKEMDDRAIESDDQKASAELS